MSFARLTDAQREQLRTWLPDATLIADLSWNLADSYVWHVRAGERDFIVKAGGVNNQHIAREISAHDGGIQALRDVGAVPQCRFADAAARLLVTDFLAGHLVLGSASESEPAVYEQAGRLLRLLHDSGSQRDDRIDRQLTKKSLQWLRRPHRIPAAQVAQIRAIMADYTPQPVTVVPCHGDYSTRNWLIHAGRISIIDFGRFGHRPAVLDLLRLAGREWRMFPGTKEAFFVGYGNDSSILATDYARISELREAVGTAVWAYGVGDEPFEVEGLDRLSVILATY